MLPLQKMPHSRQCVGHFVVHNRAGWFVFSAEKTAATLQADAATAEDALQ